MTDPQDEKGPLAIKVCLAKVAVDVCIVVSVFAALGAVWLLS